MKVKSCLKIVVLTLLHLLIVSGQALSSTYQFANISIERGVTQAKKVKDINSNSSEAGGGWPYWAETWVIYDVMHYQANKTLTLNYYPDRSEECWNYNAEGYDEITLDNCRTLTMPYKDYSHDYCYDSTYYGLSLSAGTLTTQYNNTEIPYNNGICKLPDWSALKSYTTFANSSEYSIKIVNCKPNQKVKSIKLKGTYSVVNGTDIIQYDTLLINGIKPIVISKDRVRFEDYGDYSNNYSSSATVEWNLPFSGACGDTFNISTSSLSGLFFGKLTNAVVEFVYCDLKISNLTVTNITLNTSSGESVGISGAISDSSGQPINWNVTVAGQTFSGTGKAPSFSWDGKDNNGQIVPEGTYQATLTAKTADGTCSDSKSIPITVKSTCDLKAGLTGPGKNLAFGAGSSYPIKGSYTSSSSDPINWKLTLPDGSSKSGSGNDINSIWNGNYFNGTLATPGIYEAVLTVSSSADNSCTSTQKLLITITEAPPNQCGLFVSFGSSAHMANGNLTHSQDLFFSRGGVLPAGISLYYNSLDSAHGALGRGWSHGYDISLRQNGDGSVLISEPNWKYKYYTLQNGAYVGQPGNNSTLAKKSDGTFTLTSKDGQGSTFDSTGKLTSISDRNGNILNLAYSNNSLSSVTDPSGRTVSLAYDAANHLTSITDPTGNAYTFTVAGNSLTSVTQPDGGVWKYTYDANSYMLTKSDPLGNVTSYGYDDQHRVVSSIDPEGRTRGITYPQTTETVKSTTFTEKDGGVWTYSYDTQKGTLNSKTDPQGGTTSYDYDASGNRISTTNPDGTTTMATYDNAGNMLTSTDALGQTTGYSYNSFGQVTGITDPQGVVTTYGYDAKGNMTSLTDPNGGVTSYTYDSKGNVTKITNPAGQTTTFAYDTTGNLSRVTDPTGASTSYTYDAAGNVTAITDTSGAITKFVYDSRNRLIKNIDPSGNATIYNYDANGNKLSETDGNGNVTRYEYNNRNQLIKTIDALGSATSYAYGGSSCPSCGGGADKLTALTDANGNITSYLYDQLGRSVKENDPLGNSTAYAYDARNNPVSRTDANGNTINYSYDPNGRLLKKGYPDGTEESFTYDAKGNILTATNANISYSFSYDAAGRMISSADSTGRVISYEYDLLGNKTKMISPEGKSLAYAYDKANRLTSIINGGTFTFGYDSKGQRTSLAYPNGDTATYGYDKQGRLTSLLRKNATGTVISSNNYTLDKIGNRQTHTTQDRTNNYSYDTTYRLSEALVNTPGYSTNTKATKGTTNAVEQQKDYFTYDPVGNRLTSANNKSYAYGPANQLISENGTTYSFDKNGNMTQKSTATETTSYAWDFENRLIKVTTPTTTSEYAYDPFGRRIEKKTTESGATATTKFFYDGQSILFDYDEAGAIGNKYIHGPNIDEPLMVTTGKDKYYYHADGLGSIIALTDQTGKTVQTYEYDSFGNLKDLKNRIKQPFTYTGREWDKEIGLYFYRARYYDPMEGRFIQKDPIGFRGGINLYSYVQNNPINRVDPSGLTDILYDTFHNTLSIFSGNGEYLGSFPAHNNAQKSSRGPWDSGMYDFSTWNPHRGDDADSSFGSNGNFIFDVPGCVGCGVHSGRHDSCDKAGRCGEQFATNGCIRTTDHATALLRFLHTNGDTVKTLSVW